MPLLDRIEREAERLNEMIGRLLTLARLQSASGPPEKERVRVGQLLEQVSEDAQFEAAAKGCTVRFDSKGDCVVVGDRELLRSAIENVVRNAVRYTADASEVVIDLGYDGADRTPGRATIAVRDHGPGLPESELENIFRPFYRVAGARERQTGGTGLGLAITDRAVRLHGGSVYARNVPGGGLEVKITLPAAGA
jgi:two-component system sensor histidine kinase CpxA